MKIDLIDKKDKELPNTGDLIYSDNYPPVFLIRLSEKGQYAILYAETFKLAFHSSYTTKEPLLEKLDNWYVKEKSENLTITNKDTGGVK